ncbi:MAG TPA: RagB/SusD family nutrient uptake outer membrane protein [Puia sp.]|nr:RagB/SusD family nutrient uptake outer membrane protein [Puia sp.]
MKIVLSLCLSLLLLASCSKWLDVKPESQVSAEQLFSTQTGFEEALNGVYTRCSQQGEYGDELTFGFLDVLAQNYSIPSQDYQGYLQTSIYNYGDNNFVSRKDTVWSGLYNAIANCNLILANIEQGKKLLSAVDYGIIKGEALAMRGYLHLDLLRMFAPSYVNNPNAPAIPYITDFSDKVTPLSTVSGALSLIIQDLDSAKGLLKPVDPILSPGYVVGYASDDANTEQSNPTLFLQSRRTRLNYYAVCGALARAYLYKGDQADALSNALEVIQSGKFPWTNAADFRSANPQTIDRVMYKELLFCWYIPSMGLTLQSRFQDATGSYIDANGGASLYQTGGVGGTDLRYKEWFQPMSANGQNWLDVVKYSRDVDTNMVPIVAPALRLSEMYYIAAECTYDANPVQATAYVDSVLVHRGIGTPISAADKEDFMNQLVQEARKEFYGEGQIFYMYKRLGMPIVAPSGLSYPANNSIFVLPLPNNEIEFGNR